MPSRSVLLGAVEYVSTVLPPPVWQVVRHVDRVTIVGVFPILRNETRGHDEGVDLDVVGVEAKLASFVDDHQGLFADHAGAIAASPTLAARGRWGRVPAARGGSP